MTRLIKDLQWRHAAKAFKPEVKIPEEKVEQILEAIRLAPTSSGLQPFKVFVIKNQALKEKLANSGTVLNPLNMKTASHVLVFAAWDNYTDERIDMMYDLTTDVRGLPRGRFSNYTDMIKAHFNSCTAEQNFQHAAKQTYIALGLALAQAAELHVDSCPAEGFSPELLDQELNLRAQGLRSVTIMYLGESDPEHDWLKPMTKARVSRDDLVEVIA